MLNLIVTQLPFGENHFQYEKKDLSHLISALEQKGYATTDLRVEFCWVRAEEGGNLLKGKLNFKVDLDCARCAEKYQSQVEFPFLLAMVKEVDEESPDCEVFNGEQIDLEPIFEEQFFLSLPYQNICKENCLGICQICGVNLNLSPCGCAKEEKESPFSVLKSFKVH